MFGDGRPRPHQTAAAVGDANCFCRAVAREYNGVLDGDDPALACGPAGCGSHTGQAGPVLIVPSRLRTAWQRGLSRLSSA